jgi:hypothetical protein
MVYDGNQLSTAARWLRHLVVPALVLGLAVSPGLAAGKGPGYVDPDTFIKIAGDDAVLVQVSIGQALLRMITRSSPDMERIAGGLESIEAVVLDVSRRGVAESAGKALRDTESRLRKNGWERIVLVRDEDGEVRILVLPKDDKVEGLVVLIIENSDNTMVFANIAGTVDLAAIEEIGEAFEIPGLEDIEIDE